MNPANGDGALRRPKEKKEKSGEKEREAVQVKREAIYLPKHDKGEGDAR